MLASNLTILTGIPGQHLAKDQNAKVGNVDCRMNDNNKYNWERNGQRH